MAWLISPDYSARNRVPGKCNICNLPRRMRPGTTDDYEKVFFTGIEIDFEGDVEICSTCIKEAASKLGMLSVESVTDLRDEFNTAAAEIESLKQDVQDAKDQLRIAQRQSKQAAAVA